MRQMPLVERGLALIIGSTLAWATLGLPAAHAQSAPWDFAKLAEPAPRSRAEVKLQGFAQKARDLNDTIVAEESARASRAASEQSAAMDAHTAARNTCGSASQPCYTQEFDLGDYITVRCEAGFKKGSSETVWKGKTPGCYKTSAFSGSCDTFDRTARFMCRLDK